MILAPGRRRALTLVECLATIAVAAVLLALLLPAVQAAREASRRAACVNNLKQLALGLQGYAAAHGLFPSINAPTFRIGERPGTVSAHCYSPIARMLPHLDGPALFNAINFDLPATRAESLHANLTAMTAGVDLALCPSDPAPRVRGYGRCSYRFGLGPSPWKAAGDNVPESWSGPFTSHRFYGPADFADGLSNTVGIAERSQGDWTAARLSGGDYLLTDIPSDPIGGGDRALALCTQKQAPGGPHESRSGESWFLSGFHFSNYNHCAPPNARIVDCAFARHTDDLHFRTIVQGVFTARSAHPGGVSVALMDGTVRFVKDAIALPTWRALSTRSGGEVVGFD